MAGNSAQRISNAIVNVDEFNMGTIPGDTEYKEGFPERSVEGLDNGDVVTSADYKTAVGMIKFSVPATKVNTDISKVLGGRAISTVKVTSQDGFVRVMKKGTLKNGNSVKIGTDGKIEFEYNGTPLQ